MSYKEISFNPKANFEFGEITNTDEIRELLVRYLEPGMSCGMCDLIGYSNEGQKCMMTLDSTIINMESDGTFSVNDNDNEVFYSKIEDVPRRLGVLVYFGEEGMKQSLSELAQNKRFLQINKKLKFEDENQPWIYFKDFDKDNTDVEIILNSIISIFSKAFLVKGKILVEHEVLPEEVLENTDEKVAKINLTKEPGYLYYLEDDGHVWRSAHDPNKIPQKELVKKTYVRRDNRYVYFVDKSGDLARYKMDETYINNQSGCMVIFLLLSSSFFTMLFFILK